MIPVNKWHRTPNIDRDHGSRGLEPHGRNSGRAGSGQVGPFWAATSGVDLCAIDERALDPAQHVQRVTGPDDQVRVLAWLERAGPVVDAREPRGVDGQRPER